MTSATIRRTPHRLGYVHCTLTGAAVLGVVFLLCWATSAVADIPASRMFLGMFVESTLKSPPQAMAGGLLAAMLAGGVIGALIALWFNLLAFTHRR